MDGTTLRGEIYDDYLDECETLYCGYLTLSEATIICLNGPSDWVFFKIPLLALAMVIEVSKYDKNLQWHFKVVIQKVFKFTAIIFWSSESHRPVIIWASP